MAVMAASRSDQDADAAVAAVAGYSNAMRSGLDRALGAVDAADAAVVGCCYCWRTFVNDCSMVAVASEDSVGLLLLLERNVRTRQ